MWIITDSTKPQQSPNQTLCFVASCYSVVIIYYIVMVCVSSNIL